MDSSFSNSTIQATTPNYLAWEHFQTPASICTNSTLLTACDTLKIGDYVIMEPELLPTCVMALVLGLTLAHKTIKIKAKNSLWYAMTFAMIGVMMTDAGWNDCLLPNLFPNNKLIHFYYALIDVGLTSTIGFLFMVDGLLDAGILSAKSKAPWIIFGTGAVSIFAGWTYALSSGSDLAFFILYMVVVGIGCGTWVIIQTVLIIKDKDWGSIKWLLLAGSNGGLGLFSIMDARMQVWLCENLNCHFATNFIWFLVTDTALYFIYRYYKSRVRCQAKNQYARIAEKEAFSLPWL